MKRLDRESWERRRRKLKRESYRRDFAQFAREQVKIRGAEPGQILTLDVDKRPAQQFLHARCDEHFKERGYIRVRALKARQQGFSTYCEGRAFHGSALIPNFNSLLIACDRETTQTIFRIARFAFDQLHPMFGLKARYDSKQELVFEHATGDSRMTFVQAKELAGTGTTIHFLHTSETAKWPDKACDMLETSLMPALHMVKGTVHIDESTAFTRGDYFRQKCDATRAGEDFYGWVMVPWWFDPTYQLPMEKGERFTRTQEERELVALAKAGQKKDGVPPFDLTNEYLKWKRVKLANAGADREALWPQEYLETYDDAWVTMDTLVFDLAGLQRQEKHIRPPKWLAEVKPSHANNYSKDKVRLHPTLEAIGPDKEYFAVWKLPQEGHHYAMGVDVALGIASGDYTVFEVFDMATREQVAEAHIHEDPDDAGWLAFTFGMFYNEAEINVELTGPGYNTDSRLKKLYYRNLYIWRNRERIVPKLTNLTGWKTTPESKKFLIGTCRPLFNHDIITVHSRVLLDELRHFVVVPGFIQDQYYAETGDDDCVMSMMFTMAVIHDENYLEDITPDGSSIKEPTPEERALVRHTEVEQAIVGGPAVMDNWEPGGTPSTLDTLIGSLKGWD